MSSTASNYDLRRLEIGIGIVALAVVISLATSSAAVLEVKQTGFATSCIFVPYGLMMFASSYVEEEHHFWYWASSGWLAWLILSQ